MLTLTLHGRRVVAEQWAPLVVSGDGVPRPPSAARAQEQLRERAEATACFGLAAAPQD